MKQGNQLLASMFLGYPHCYPEMGEWICRFINLMQGEHLRLKNQWSKLLSKSSTVLSCEVWFISLGPKVTGPGEGSVFCYDILASTTLDLLSSCYYCAFAVSASSGLFNVEVNMQFCLVITDKIL